ncbi:MAG: hypothetical protein KGK03_06980 [Candidatus Omnitrophica bacterium]|nr:hypothetical protein [Candidatus Omnitrophota bacterium]
MSLIKLSGKAASVKQITTTVLPNNCYINTTTTFRINNRPLSTTLNINLTEGDQVTAVAEDKPQELAVLAVRNETTGVTHAMPEVKPALNIVTIIFGILTIPLLGVGFWIIYSVFSAYQTQLKQYGYQLEVNRMLA